MFSAKNTDNPNPFRPALQYLLNGKSQSNRKRGDSSPSIDSRDLDSDIESARPKMNSELRPAAYPLITLSRSPSPYNGSRSRSTSAPISESEDESDAAGRPFLLLHDGRGDKGLKGLFQGGGLGRWLFTTSRGWQFYIGFLVLWVGGCGIGLSLMNRIVLLTGVYKFPYPLTTTLLQLFITHFLLILMANLTRWFGRFLIAAGLASAVAPSHPLNPPAREARKGGLLSSLSKPHSGGIAGGGLFEFDLRIAREVVPLAILYILKVVLSNLSFAYALLPMYLLARMAIVPLSLILTSTLGRTPHSIAIWSSALAATLNLLIATSRSNVRVTWESIVAGAFSSIFVALYPLQIQRTYKALVAAIVPQGEVLNGYSSTSSTGSVDASGSKEESRAIWRLFHYTSLVSILILTPIVILSGEPAYIYHNCYFLDVFFHWLMMTCSGIGSWSVFFSTMVLVRATSPLTATFVFIPKAAFMLMVLEKFKMPAYSWVGIGMCWICSAWFLLARRKEGRTLGRLGNLK